MISLQKTLSSIFIVPLLGMDRNKLIDERVGFINAYMFDPVQGADFTDAVFLLFKPLNLMYFNDLLKEERERGFIITEYDYADGYVVLVYAIPQKLLAEKEKFLTGKYSEFSLPLKESYPKVVKIIDRLGLRKDEMALQWRIFKKDANLRKYWEDLLDEVFDEDMEVWSVFDKDRETLKIEQIKAPVEM